MTSSKNSLTRYLLFVAVMLALFWAQDDVKEVQAAPLRATARIQPVAQPIVAKPALVIEVFTASVREREYLPVPEEAFFDDMWKDIWKTKERWTVSYLPIIEHVLETNDYPNIDAMLVMGLIIQESGGDPHAVCNDFDTARGTCAFGLMALSPAQCGLTPDQLKNSAKNIACGTRIINVVYEQALEHGFKPGKEATRAALAAYNCSWSSLLADRCYSFGGWRYADLILKYWTPLLEEYLD